VCRSFQSRNATSRSLGRSGRGAGLGRPLAADRRRPRPSVVTQVALPQPATRACGMGHLVCRNQNEPARPFSASAKPLPGAPILEGSTVAPRPENTAKWAFRGAPLTPGILLRAAWRPLGRPGREGPPGSGRRTSHAQSPSNRTKASRGGATSRPKLAIVWGVFPGGQQNHRHDWACPSAAARPAGPSARFHSGVKFPRAEWSLRSPPHPPPTNRSCGQPTAEPISSTPASARVSLMSQTHGERSRSSLGNKNTDPGLVSRGSLLPGTPGPPADRRYSRQKGRLGPARARAPSS